MKTIVFQGDSITDAQRNRSNMLYMGNGYATMTAGKIAVDHPGEYRFYNCGIGGDRSADMYARIKKDVLNLKPDILTILIGVNDVWHEFGAHNGISASKYEMLLTLFVKEVQEEYPDVKIFLLEPFVLSGTATEANFDTFSREVALRADACKRIAQAYGLAFVPLQEKLQALANVTSVDYVLHDGVHPTCAGHELISRALLEAMRCVL